jgi:hypothetical protein
MTHPNYLWLLYAILATAVQGQVTTVCAEYTDVFSVNYTPPAVTYYMEFSFTDNREQIIGIGYCTANSPSGPLRLQTWRMKYKLNGSGADTEVLFGGPESPWTCTAPDSITQDITQFTAYIDDEDIEGLQFVLEDGTVLDYKANYMFTEPLLVLPGRPLGFKALFGENSSGTDNMPLQVQVIYNACMCPLS